MLEQFLIFVGLYALCWYLYENLRAPLFIFTCRLKEWIGGRPERNLHERYGEWAAITGASDGIGKAYAKELARKGLNVVLISRTESKLQTLAEQIERESGVKTKIIVADFTKGAEVYEHIEKELGSLPVGILVNNVGQSTTDVGIMAALPACELWNVIQTNVVAVTLMSRLFAVRMHITGQKGCIVNVSSGTEILSVKYAALYVASKAFTRTLTLTLQQELKPYGIEVQLVSPGFVLTKITAYSKLLQTERLLIPNPDTYARCAVSTIGQLDITSGYFWHGLTTDVLKLFPFDLRSAAANQFIKLAIDDKPKFL